ncbi:hypothetical protein ACDL51_13905, partial [Enterococcus faecalis]|uniref:hypothetical protein n=1 Tax=Enterococcus faecalis TaxID=1351 RepID=UPI0035315F83
IVYILKGKEHYLNSKRFLIKFTTIFLYSYSTNSSAIYWLLAKILICVLCIYFFLIEYKKQKSCNHGPE